VNEFLQPGTIPGMTPALDWLFARGKEEDFTIPYIVANWKRGKGFKGKLQSSMLIKHDKDMIRKYSTDVAIERQTHKILIHL